MTAIPAKRRVAFVLYPRVTLLDVTGPLQVFSEANELHPDGPPCYEVVLTSEAGGQVTTDTGLVVNTIAMAELPETVDAIVVSGGPGVFDASSRQTLVDQLRTRALYTPTVASTCMGTFLLAATGLLSDRRVTTHWRWAEKLQNMFPELSVQSDAFVVMDGKYWSSGGVTAGMDLALKLLDRDLGADVKRAVAARLVLNANRPGEQTQYAPTEPATSKYGSRFAALHEWIDHHLSDDLTVERLAAHAGMSPRNFARIFVASEGATPASAVELLRVHRARRLLEDRSEPMKSVAHKCGFRTVDRMRKAFLRTLGATPSEYRSRFGAP